MTEAKGWRSPLESIADYFDGREDFAAPSEPSRYCLVYIRTYTKLLRARNASLSREHPSQ